MVSNAFSSDESHICAFNVTNDRAEYLVKLSTNFTEVAPVDGHFQNVLHVVEDHPHKRPTFASHVNTSRQVSLPS